MSWLRYSLPNVLVKIQVINSSRPFCVWIICGTSPPCAPARLVDPHCPVKVEFVYRNGVSLQQFLHPKSLKTSQCQWDQVYRNHFLDTNQYFDLPRISMHSLWITRPVLLSLSGQVFCEKVQCAPLYCSILSIHQYYNRFPFNFNMVTTLETPTLMLIRLLH